ncbi:hypothetical protein L195_g028800 [Trifolium pratense]|uniref:Uncharacterized protein n=1 Tax=Trifolium pratense TaxID=57577 RepID=A0A2K3L2Y9_TRIPR|nr:hypothetical protein L195_g028800 [Trifolium pratense]
MLGVISGTFPVSGMVSSGFGKCPPNHFTAFSGSRLPITWIKKDNQRKSYVPECLDNNELHLSNSNVPRDSEFQHGYTYKYKQHVRKEVVQCISSFVVSTIVFLAFTNMQKAMLIFWVVFMHLQSANSIIEVFVTLVGGLFMGWFAFGKSNHLMK